MNIFEIIAKETKNHLKRIAIVDQNQTITYVELFERIEQTCREFKNQGIGKFARVALLADDSIDYIIASLAVLKLCAVIVPVPFGSAQDEIQELLKELKVNFLITVTDKIKAAKLKIKGRAPAGFYKINPAFIRFTSGTTGKNKGVVLSHESIIQRTQAANQGLKIQPGERIIWVLSMSFHFVVTILLFLRRGATIILSSRNFPQILLQNLAQQQPTFIYASPMHYHLLSSLNIPKATLSKVRLAVSTAIKLPDAIAEKFSQKFGFQLAESYGIIEIGLPFINSSGDIKKRGSVGKILPGYKIKISNPDAQGIGEIQIKSRGMFDAYFSPWRPRQKVLSGGWFNTGDLGRLDQEGYLFILGRHKQLINFNGMKIFPFEIENLLNSHPLIKECLVYAKPHSEYGQLPAAKIVLKNKSARPDGEILRKFCYQHLASYKVPKEFLFVDSLPKTPSGKIIRRFT